MRLECNGAGERRRSDGDPWGAIERSRSESRRGVTRRGDRELKPSDCPPLTARRRRSGVPRGHVPLARRGPGMARGIPAKRHEGHAVAGMPVRITT